MTKTCPFKFEKYGCHVFDDGGGNSQATAAYIDGNLQAVTNSHHNISCVYNETLEDAFFPDQNVTVCQCVSIHQFATSGDFISLADFTISAIPSTRYEKPEIEFEPLPLPPLKTSPTVLMVIGILAALFSVSAMRLHYDDDDDLRRIKNGGSRGLYGLIVGDPMHSEGVIPSKYKATDMEDGQNPQLQGEEYVGNLVEEIIDMNMLHKVHQIQLIESARSILLHKLIDTLFPSTLDRLREHVTIGPIAQDTNQFLWPVQFRDDGSLAFENFVMMLMKKHPLFEMFSNSKHNYTRLERGKLMMLSITTRMAVVAMVLRYCQNLAGCEVYSNDESVCEEAVADRFGNSQCQYNAEWMECSAKAPIFRQQYVLVAWVVSYIVDRVIFAFFKFWFGTRGLKPHEAKEEQLLADKRALERKLERSPDAGRKSARRSIRDKQQEQSCKMTWLHEKSI